MRSLFVMLLMSFSLFATAKETIKIIVPYPAGGTSDKLARQLQTHLSNEEYNFVVENKAGAGGSIGATFVASEKNEPLLIVSGQALVTNVLLGNVKYSLDTDLKFISCLTTDPIVVVSKVSGPIDTYSDIKRLGEKQTVAYGTSGAGSVQSMISPLVAGEQKNQIEIPFKGAPDVKNALLSDVIMWYVDNIALVDPLIQGGKFKLLAASTKLNKYPNVPVFKDLGIELHGFKSRQLFASNTALSLNQRAYIIKRMNEKSLSQVFSDMGFDSCIDTSQQDGFKGEMSNIKRLLKQ